MNDPVVQFFDANPSIVAFTASSLYDIVNTVRSETVIQKGISLGIFQYPIISKKIFNLRLKESQAHLSLSKKP